MYHESDRYHYPSKSKPKTLILIMILSILLSGSAGFGGVYIANGLIGMQANAPIDIDRDSRLDEFMRASNAMGLSTGEGFTVAQVAALVADSVVEIRTEAVSSNSRLGQYITSGAGSGVIIDPSGYIVTNNHVVLRAERITVRLRNGESYDAELLGKDARTDLAVLKIEGEGLPAADFGDSDSLVIGEAAVVIGNPLGELGGTVTEGIISALNRDIVIEGESMTLLQTSAAINPGNSGGGLFNARGELVGIVNAKSAGTNIEGLGFAIPVNTAKGIIEEIATIGYVSGRPALGVTLVDITDQFTALMNRVEGPGVYVSQNTGDSGLQTGDRIISIEGEMVFDTADVKAAIEKFTAGQDITVEVSRSKRTIEVSVTLQQAR